MRDFLGEYLITLSGKKATSIHELLSAARVSKNDLDSIAAKLQDSKRDSPIVISKEKFGSLIQRASFDSANRDANRRILDLFQVSNRISVLLDSHTAILSSEVKALQDELIAMEKAIDNYAFTLSDNGFYDYAFTETFNDETFRETDIDVRLSDRSGVNFSSDEIGTVNSAAGILSLSPALKNKYPITADIINSNCSSLITSNTGLDRALNADVSNGWRVAISAPKPITSKIDSTVSVQGAQMELEIFLQSPAPCDTIVLTPFSDMAVDVIRVLVYPEVGDDTKVVSVLSEATTLDRSVVVNFPLQPVAKFRVLLNQSVYSRGETSPAQYEVAYREIYEDIKDKRENVSKFLGKPYKKNKKALKRIFLNAQARNVDTKIFKSEIPEIDFDPSFGPLTIDKIVQGYNPNNPKQDMWSFQSKTNHFMRRMIDEKVFANNTEIMNDRHVYNVNNAFLSSNTPLQMTMMSGNSNPSQKDLSSQVPISAGIIAYPTIQEQQFLDYQYNLGLRNIEIGTGERIYRGIFISKQIPAESDSGEVKLRSEDFNYMLVGTSRDSATITSIEYSISNKSTPASEEDWIPILPIGSSKVDAERVFLTESGIGYLRFPASINDSFEIYKGGYKVDLAGVTINKTSDNAAVKSFQLNPGTFTSTDIFTVTYTPYGDQSIINFLDRGVGQTILATAYDDSGAGETFNNTLNNQVITLKNEPYVDYDSVYLNGSYSSTLGFQGSYQPITIIMSDGSIALNQTNYKGITQNNLSSFDETKTAFIHSGKNIVFNKPISTKFTVFYQYLPSNLRFRIVMRVNDSNYVSPSVNSVQVKTKTRKPNSRKKI